VVWQPRPNDRFYRFMVRIGLALRALFRVRVIITGQEHLPARAPLHGASRRVTPGEGAVVAITHFGYLDFAFAALVLWDRARAQLRFLITQGAADHWLAGPAISAAGQVVVPYGPGSGAYAAAVAKLRAGEYIAVLPEAGVSRSFTVRECKTGAVRMAAEANVPIIPVSVWGAHRLMTRGHGFSPLRAWRAPVRVHVGRPVPPAGLPAPDLDARPATEKLRRILQDGIDTATADFPLAPAPGAWWMPAHLGGSAPTDAERQRLDQAEGPRRQSGRRLKPADPQ